MPPKKNKKQKKSHHSTSRGTNSILSEVSSTSVTDESAINSTMRSTTSYIADVQPVYTKAALTEKMNEFLGRVEESGQKAVEEVSSIYSALRMSLTPEQLQTRVSLVCLVLNC